MRDTFDRNPGLCQLFKAKIREKCVQVGLSADLIDFDAHILPNGTYAENLQIFYREYPQLTERSNFVKLGGESDKGFKRDFAHFAKASGVEPEKQVVAVGTAGAEIPATPSPEPTYPTLSFQFNYEANAYTEPPKLSGPEKPENPEIPTLNFSFTTETVSAIPEPKPESVEVSRPELKPERLVDGPSKRLRTALSEPTQVLIVGKHKSGKTALASMVLEKHHGLDHACFWYRHPKPELLPDWITVLSDLADLPPDAACVIDEAPLHGFDQFSFRQKKTMQLGDIMEIARQNNQSIIVISQVSAQFNRDLTFPVDVYLLKEPSPMQRLEERQLLKDAYAEIKEHIAQNEYYWLDGEIFEKTTFQKPEWFTQELSEAYRNYRPNEQTQDAQKKPNGRALPRIRINYEPETAKTEPKQRTEQSSGPMFDKPGLLFSSILGTVGFLTLLRGAWWSLLLLGLAALDLIFSHRRFGRYRN